MYNSEDIDNIIAGIVRKLAAVPIDERPEYIIEQVNTHARTEDEKFDITNDLLRMFRTIDRIRKDLENNSDLNKKK